MRVNMDMTELQRIEREFPVRAGQLVQKLAQDTQGDIVNNFSPNSPSSPGDPPGVDTGALKNSVVAVPDTRPLTWLLLVGQSYGVDLEYGTEKMAARPFVLPAVERTFGRMPTDLERLYTF